MRTQVWTATLAMAMAALGGVVVGGTLFGSSPARARTASSSDDVVIVTGAATGGRPEILYIVDTVAERLLAVELSSVKKQWTPRLGAVRDIRHDLQLRELPNGQEPSVPEVEEATKGEPDPPRSGTRKILAATGAYIPGQNDLLWLYDTASRRIVTYHFTGKALNILGARKVFADLKLKDYPVDGTNIPVEEVRKKVKGR
jgi:hypothetical protein